MPSKPIARPAKPVSITEGFKKINALINRTPIYKGNGDGVGFLSLIIGYKKAIIFGLLPFIPSELFKITLAVLIIPSVIKYIK